MERAVYRIIDANFNRAREAARVIEEFCRFALNSAQHAQRAKRLRHELSLSLDKLDARQLLSSRDILGDVGAPCSSLELRDTGHPRFRGDRLTPAEAGARATFMERTDLNSTFTAACKRLTEALRTLTETIAIGGQNQSVADAIEKLRFDAYALEKDIVLWNFPAEKFKRVKLYVIISSNEPSDIIRLTQRCIAGGADCIQLRSKNIADDSLFAVAVEFVKVCKAAGVLSIINDRVDVAVTAGADGVHLGQNDLPIEQARKLQLAPLIIGLSTHSLQQLRCACAAYPTYVSLGPVFSTDTKPQVPPVGLDYVEQATKELADTGIGNVAIGGITLSNVEDVLRAGVKAVAVCSVVSEAKDPTAACRALKEKIAAFPKK